MNKPIKDYTFRASPHCKVAIVQNNLMFYDPDDLDSWISSEEPIDLRDAA